MPDRYSYPNSLVLINKLGITDYDRWKAVETAAIHQRMVELTEHPTPGRYDLPHLRAIHRHLTHDLYVWGGDIRDTVEAQPANLIVRRFVQSTVNGALSEVSMGRDALGNEPQNSDSPS